MDAPNPCERHKAIAARLATPEGQAALRAAVKAHVMGPQPAPGTPEERGAPARLKPPKPTTQGDLFA